MGDRNDMLSTVQTAQMACDRTAWRRVKLWSTALSQPKDDDDDDDDDDFSLQQNFTKFHIFAIFGLANLYMDPIFYLIQY